MLGDQYELEYLPLFDEELAEAVRYIAQELRNPEANEWNAIYGKMVL